MIGNLHDIQKLGVGLLIGDSKLKREEIYKQEVEFTITNDPRIIAALKLMGGETLEKKKITGVEMFM